MTSNTKKVGNPFRKIQFANLTLSSLLTKIQCWGLLLGRTWRREGGTTGTQFKCFDSLVKENDVQRRMMCRRHLHTLTPAVTVRILIARSKSKNWLFGKLSPDCYTHMHKRKSEKYQVSKKLHTLKLC